MNVTKFLILIVPVLLSVAFLTLMERKLLSLIGLRVGPNKVSYLGFLQPVGDAVKLSNKQTNLLSDFSLFFYYLSSLMMFFSAVYLWMTIFVDPRLLALKFSILWIMLLLGFNSFNSILSGWSTFCKYSLIGSLRTVAQLLSYEASLYLCLFIFIIFLSSFSMDMFFFYFIHQIYLFLPLVFYVWLPSFLAELNRTPYDFSEGESELVSGFNTEFGSKSFTLIFLAEYSNILFFSLVSAILFFFGFTSFFFFFVFFSVIWVRSVLPRFRFDKLMILAWKFLIPSMTIFLVASVVFCF